MKDGGVGRQSFDNQNSNLEIQINGKVTPTLKPLNMVIQESTPVKNAVEIAGVSVESAGPPTRNESATIHRVIESRYGGAGGLVASEGHEPAQSMQKD